MSVLIVEDEAMIAMMLEEFVGSLGHHVRATAHSLDEAIAAVEEGGVELAILDCNLEGREVWPLADMLGERNIPYILSTGGSVSDIPAAYADRPMLSKPYTIGTIAQVLGSVNAA